jgi:hypothetical protein
MKKRISIALILCYFSPIMTVWAMSDKFLSWVYVIKMGFALLLPIIAIIIIVMQKIKKDKETNRND